MRFLLVSFCVVLSSSRLGAETTCPTNAPKLHDLERRARNNVNDHAEEPLVDDSILTRGWYSVSNAKGQYVMPDSSTIPLSQGCGTYLNIHLNGTHPDIKTLTEKPVERTACLQRVGKECYLSYGIKIRKCRNDIQYYLVPTKDMSAYCFDPPELQGNKKSTDFSPPPTDVKLGKIEVKPELRHTLFKDGTYVPHLLFKCIFNHKPDSSFYYYVNWYINGDYFQAIGPTNLTADLFLTEKKLLEQNVKLGFNVKCGIRVAKDESGQTTSIKFSDGFFAGIKIFNTTIEVPKNSKVTILLKPTVPLGCMHNEYIPGCFTAIRMLDPVTVDDDCKKDKLLHLEGTGRKCSQHLQALNQNETFNESKTYEFTITTQDVNYNDRNSYILQLRLAPDADTAIWRAYQPDDIHVIVTNTEGYKDKVCYAHVDPHMKTSDGYYYESQDPGYYLMYKNTIYSTEVQYRVAPCNKNIAQCICALIVRAGADVFLFDFCGSTPIIEYPSCRDGGILTVLKITEYLYKINTPIGSIIMIQLLSGAYKNFMNVDITMAPKDMNNVEGLCGHFDNIMSNDLKKRNGVIIPQNSINIEYHNVHKEFTDNWRLNDSENLFKMDLDKLPKWTDNHPLFCVCKYALPSTATSESNERVAEAICTPSPFMNCNYKNKSPKIETCKISERKKRSTRDVFDKHKKEMKRLMLMAQTSSQTVRDGIKKRKLKRDVHDNGISKSDAKGNCSLSIDGSPAVTEFADKMLGQDKNAVIAECTYDVVVGNDLSLAKVHVDSLNSAVSQALDLEPEFAANNTEKIVNFKKSTCLSNCTNRGECSETGTCICDTLFHGPDCSIDERLPIDITDIEGGGLCDLMDGDDCSCVYVRTRNLVWNFTCQITGRNIYVDEVEEAIPLTKDNGIYEDIFTGKCCVSSGRTKRSAESRNVFTTQYHINISNDGQHFGGVQSLYVIDSTCQNVNHNGPDSKHIELKNDYCYIEGRCVQKGETKFDQMCSICDPSSSMYNWTLNCFPSTDDKEDNLGIILGTTLGIGLSAAFVVIAYVVWRLKIGPSMRKRKSVGNSQMIPNTTFETPDAK